jgi:hypothetical protein
MHAHANGHRHRQFIRSLECNGQVHEHEDQKADVAFNFFDELLGTPSARSHLIDLHCLQLPGLDERFMEQEILAIIRDMPQGKALGLNGFMTRFLHQAWDIIRPDIMKSC